MTSNTDFQAFFNNLLSGNRSQCKELAEKYTTNNSDIKYFYEEILMKALYEVGRLWENHKISIAAEHMASAIAESILNDLYLKIMRSKFTDKTAVIACTENEYHRIGAKMVADIFEVNGWSAHTLGVNTKTDDILTFIKSAKPDIVGLSLTLSFNLPVLKKMVKTIKTNFPNQAMILGGQAFTQISDYTAEEYHDVAVIKNLADLENFIKNLK